MTIDLKRPDGSVRAKLSLFQIVESTYGIQFFSPSELKQEDSNPMTSKEWLGLLNRALEKLREIGAKEAHIRVTEDKSTQEFFQEIPAMGFVFKFKRIEFRSPLSDLPDEVGTPLQWKIAPLNDATIATLKAAGRGDPDFDVDGEDVGAVLRGYFEDEVLTNGADCLQIGQINDKDAAIVIAQINPKTGWSRITYMGLLPEFRGRGLGKWVHRHGFAMMRAQGGTLYHGGTLAENTSMIGLFRASGCKEYRRMQEWKCKL